MINSIDTLRLNVSTLEHPVEYRLNGINQIDVGSNKELTFSSGLRALMRQDPDVILIGEIRDNETADMAFKAASTGHLVFSTVHANGSKEVIERLLNLGIDEFTLKSNLIFSSAQRLLKELCSHCSISISKDELPREIDKNLNYKKRNNGGCEKCNAGIAGRIPILEYMNERNIKSFISDKNNSDFGIVGLRESAIQLAAENKVDLFEALEIE
jgi:type II secretory ATPase GspE/PulE/Tfp pilus assembly ATPase PilB-like protein